MAAMLQEATATRPAAIAKELQTPSLYAAIAGVLADDVYTFDGRPYRQVSFGGRCEQPPVHCELTLEGMPAFSGDPDAVDSYTWMVTPATPLVTMSSHSLRGYPADLTAGLDALARSLDVDGRFKERGLLGVEWALPPPADAYVLRYGNGLEEGDPTFLVTLDQTGRRILSIRALH